MNPSIYLGLKKTQQLQYRAAMISNEGDIANRIKMIVCREYKVDTSDVESHSRKQIYVIPRFIAIWIIRWETKLTLQQIGELLGNRNHGSILNAISVIDDYTETDRYFKKRFQEVLNIVQAELKTIRTLNQQ